RRTSRRPECRMAAKQIAFDAQARDQLKAGIDALANAVRVTLGPRGRNVALDKKWGPPTVTHDGVTVAKAVEEGVLPGGGTALLRTSSAVDNVQNLDGDQRVGAEILKRSLDE